MGACGCGEWDPSAKLPGPDGTFYVLQVYRGCEHCNADASVIITKMTPDELALWESNVPDLEPRWTSPDGAVVESVLPVVDVNDLATMLKVPSVSVYHALRGVEREQDDD